MSDSPGPKILRFDCEMDDLTPPSLSIHDLTKQMHAEVWELKNGVSQNTRELINAVLGLYGADSSFPPPAHSTQTFTRGDTKIYLALKENGKPTHFFGDNLADRMDENEVRKAFDTIRNISDFNNRSAEAQGRIRNRNSEQAGPRFISFDDSVFGK